MKKTSHFLFVSILLMITVKLLGSNYPDNINTLYFEVISSKDNLPNSVIRGIEQDSLGFLWISSNDGLFRYDGSNYQIHRSNPSNLSSITYNYIQDMHLDHSGNPWMLFSNSLDKLDPKTGKFTHYYPASSPDGNIGLGNTYQFVITPENHIYLTSLQHGLMFFHANDTSVQRLSDEKNRFPEISSKLEAIAYDNNSLYVAKKHTGFYRIELSKNNDRILSVKKISDSAHDEAYTIFPDRGNRVWAGTSEGITLINQTTGQTSFFRYSPGKNLFLPDKEILSLYVDEKENLWIGTREGGLSIVPIREIEIKGEKAVGVFYSPTEKEGSLSNRCITQIYKDRSENIWLGTYSGGLQLVSDEKSKIHSLKYIAAHPESTSHPKVWGITQANDGNIWIGTDGGGIDVWNPQQGIIKRIKHDSPGKGISDNAILCALTDKDGFLWFGTYRGGLNRINPKTGQIKIYQKVPSPNSGEYSSDIRCIHQDSSGKIWIGTNWKGVCVYDSETDSFVNIPELGLIDVKCIIESRNGGLWIGTHSRGLTWFDPATKEIKYYITDGTGGNQLPSNDIYFLKEDLSGNLWIGTQYGGLSCFDPKAGVFKNYDSKNGLANNTVLSILEDSKGYFWLSTNEGISRFDPSTSSFINYDQTNGVLPGEFLNSSCIAGTDGNFYFGCSNGLNYFAPEYIQPSPVAPKVVFTELKVFDNQILPGTGIIDKNIEFTPTIRLNHKQSVFTISFQAIQYPFANKCQYSYMLDGYEEKWNDAGFNNNATYRQLPAGSYIMRVKASNSDGIWSQEIASINIEIIPPFWKTIWAYLFYVALMVVIIRFLFRFRMNQIRMLNQLHFEQKIRQKEHKIHHERLEFFTNISHELRTPLTLVECAVDDLKTLLGRSKNAKVNETLKTASYHSSRLMELINQLLEFRRVETGTPQILVERINLNEWISHFLANFKELADSKSISLKMSLPVKTIELWADQDKLSMILNNLLSNAFKFTPRKGTIEVTTEENDKEIKIIVHDSGTGISPKAMPHIFERYFKTDNRSTSTGIGLSLTKSLVELHQGTIKAESSLGKGSCFTITFLSGNKHFNTEMIKSNVSQPSFQPEIMETEDTLVAIKGPDENIMLIIEDNADLSTMLANKFASSFEVHTAENGEKGIKLAKSLVPDIIISDIMMPGIQGTEVCRELKKDMLTSHIPIILLTAKGTINDELAGLDTGADDYISKPFNFNILEARVNTLLQNRIKLYNYFTEKGLAPAKTAESAGSYHPEHEFLQKAEQLILEKYLQSDSSVYKLAEDMNFSRSSLYRKIKMLTGLSINEFVRSVKIKKAAELISSSDITISEAAYKVGFNDIKYFRENFIKQIGATPSEFKKRSQ